MSYKEDFEEYRNSEKDDQNDQNDQNNKNDPKKYKELFEKYYGLAKDDNIKDMNEENRLAWYTNHEPVGFYYAAEMLWNKNDQRSKDNALDYYEKFIMYPDIKVEEKEVKKAVKIVYNAYRNGYGSKKEDLSLLGAFETKIDSKGFSVPTSKKITTEPDRDKLEKRTRKFNFVQGSLAMLTTFLALGSGIYSVCKKHFKK